MVYMSKTKRKRVRRQRALGACVTVAAIVIALVAIWQIGLGPTIVKVGGVPIREGVAEGLTKFQYYYQTGGFREDPTEGLEDPAEIEQAKDMALLSVYSTIENIMIPTEAMKLHLAAQGKDYLEGENYDNVKTYTDAYFSNTTTAREFRAAGVKKPHVRYYFEYIAVVSMFRDEVNENDPVTDEDIQAYYDEHMDWWEIPPTLQASHILIMDPEHTDEKREEIEAILEQLNEGADFAELAMLYSEDGSAENGGDLGEFGLGQMVAPFEEAALALEIGETSGIVETEYGFHIIKLTNKTEASVTPLEEYYDSIKSSLESDRVTAAIDELVANTEVEYFVPVAPSTGKLPADLTELNESRGIFEEEEAIEEETWNPGESDFNIEDLEIDWGDLEEELAGDPGSAEGLDGHDPNDGGDHSGHDHD